MLTYAVYVLFAPPHVHSLCSDRRMNHQDHVQSSVVMADCIEVGSYSNFASYIWFAPWNPLALDFNVQWPKNGLVQNSIPSWGLVVFQEIMMNHYHCLLSWWILPHVFTLNYSLTCLHSIILSRVYIQNLALVPNDEPQSVKNSTISNNQQRYVQNNKQKDGNYYDW